MLVARSLAVMHGRDFVTPEDVKRVASRCSHIASR